MDLAHEQSILLSRLRRCAQWTEIDNRNGFITLMGIRANNFDVEQWEFDEKVLTDLLIAGLVECEASQRIRERQMYEEFRFSKGPFVEETVKYWKVVA